MCKNPYNGDEICHKLYTTDADDALNVYPSLRESFFTNHHERSIRLFFKIPILLGLNQAFCPYESYASLRFTVSSLYILKLTVLVDQWRLQIKMCLMKVVFCSGLINL